MRIMCHCVIFVIILTFCGVIMYSDSRDDKDYAIDYYPDSDRDEDYYSSGSSNNVILVSTVILPPQILGAVFTWVLLSIRTSPSFKRLRSMSSYGHLANAVCSNTSLIKAFIHVKRYTLL